MTDSKKTNLFPPTLADLARQTVDLWQEEVTRLTTQPETMALFARTLSTFMGASGMASHGTDKAEQPPVPDQPAAEAPPPAQAPHDSFSCSSAPGPIPTTSPNSSGTAPDTDASVDRDTVLRCLLDHVIRLEQRVDALEKGFSEKPRKRTANPPSRHPEDVS
jgi:hypothetical protein